MTIKRFLDATSSDLKNMTAIELEESIRLSEGRVICAECACIFPSPVLNVSSAEIVASMGADLVVLNGYDVNNPIIFGLPGNEFAWDIHSFYSNNAGVVDDVKKLIGRPVGINLEPTNRTDSFYQGRKATPENAKKAIAQGANFILIGGNPNAGTTSRMIIDAVEEIRNEIGDSLFIGAGKAHGAGVTKEQSENLFTDQDIQSICKAGANAVGMPMPGSLPGWTIESTRKLVDIIHKEGKLAWLVMDHGLEGAQKEVIINLALDATKTGADIFEIGDAGYAFLPWPENILDFSIAIRGRVHTFRRMAMSINR